jgi:Xaa-Pro aminopeptidase
MRRIAEARILEKLRELSPERVAEVADFIDFLSARESAARKEAADRLGVAMSRLAELEEPAMTEDEVQAEIDSVRQDRRNRVADRT